ncbi:thioredoxin domain-containing protein [Aliidongia dinghuensis]|uniref:Thioredoxin domain-containing protein n=1 Tax=Aliidongia dinghuensis TaxID=1867774 RepID=A0A8J2YYG1_9PROT|nr:thioredoxin domain-containing protein [Aliidongia dinghuensis]GGF32557.1 thioredoxin domain-containing protein [Aliidongia dinghuensis]
MASNQLAAETSPYLLQHKDNPVHWRAWGAAALAEAQATDKPVLLSVGYAACHWCHVMAAESFENPEIAAVMNELYVPIKVDREERPDIDAIYQQALALMGEQGGWPLTMFLTPKGEPFWGGTYFPPAQRWGRPGFPDVLRGVAAHYRREPDKIARNVTALANGLAQSSTARSAEDAITPALLDQIAERLAQAVDPVHGGFGQAPKFPNPSNLELLWRGWTRARLDLCRDRVLLTLDAMCQGGIYDHIGGGFARYSTDEQWLVPHFEKMLYDNAQLVSLLTAAWQETKSSLYAARIDETIGWVLREMRAPDGGFSSTIDADAEHEEGKFTVWTEAEIDRLLGPDAGLFKAHYDVTTAGNWEGKTILNRRNRPGFAHPEVEATLARCRAVLFAAREQRVHPGLDDKVLADWNGLMITALAEASLAFDRPDWLAAAAEAWRFVTTRMMPADDRLHHSWRGGRHHPGTLDDYVDMARAGLALHEATGDDAYLAQVERWVAVLDRHFGDPAGGYFFTADDTEALIVRTKSVADNAVPAGNGTLVHVLARLWASTGRAEHRRALDRQIAAFAGELERNFYPLGTYLNGLDFAMRPVQITIVGARDAEDAKALLAAVHETSLPNRLVQVVADTGSLPATHPAIGKARLGRAATAYVCIGETCSLPITEPAALAAALAGV